MTERKFLKDISLIRREERKNKKEIQFVPDKEAKTIIDQFNANIKSLRKKFEIYETLLEKELKSEAEDVLRSQIVFLLSALDFYMHEVAKYCLLKIFNGERPKTSSYKNFIVSIETVQIALKNPESVDWLSEEIILRHSHETFMSDDKIKKILAQISTKKIYEEVSKKLFKNPSDLNSLFKSLYVRRNKIAHQSDREHGTGNLNDIKRLDVEQYIDFIDRFVNEVHLKIMSED